MLKILWNRGEIAPEEQFLLLFTIFSYLMLDFYVETRIGFSLRDKGLFEITEVEITRVECISFLTYLFSPIILFSSKKKQQRQTRKSLKVMNALVISNCDFELGPTLLKWEIVPDTCIIIIHIFVKFYQIQFTKRRCHHDRFFP